MNLSFYSQAASRVAALSLPLIVVVAVRQFGSAELIKSFFVLLTDTALLVAFCKLGIDVYLPSCQLRDNKVLVHQKFKLAYMVVGTLLAVLALSSYSLGTHWQLGFAATLVLAFLGLAEIGRLKQNFIAFYFLKSPALYIGVLLVIITTSSGVMSAVVALLVLASWVYLFKIMQGEVAEIPGRALFASAMVSIVILLFSWKEAALSRLAFSSENIDSLVMYSRFALITTFPFMLQNARVPLLLKESASLSMAESINAVLSQRKMLTRLWALVTGVLVVLYAGYAEPELVLGVFFLMAASCILVVFGNISAAMIYYREYKRVFVCYFAGGSAFVVSVGAMWLLELSSFVFLVVSIASCVGQVVFGVLLKYQLNQMNAESNRQKAS